MHWKQQLTLFVLCLIISCSSRDDCLIVHWSMFYEREKKNTVSHIHFYFFLTKASYEYVQFMTLVIHYLTPDIASRGQPNLAALSQERQLNSRLQTSYYYFWENNQRRSTRFTHLFLKPSHVGYTIWPKESLERQKLKKTMWMSVYSRPVGCVWCAASEGCHHHHCPAGDVGSK